MPSATVPQEPGRPNDPAPKTFQPLIPYSIKKMSKQRTIEQIGKDIEAMRDQIGKDRDKLRELIDEAEGLVDTCDRAYEAMETAADALSELA